MRLVFMGTPLFATIIFEAIFSKHTILAVFTQCDKPVGRKGIITPPPMKVQALQKGVQVFQPSVLDSSVQKQIALLKPEAIIVVAYGKILPKEILDIAPCINVHASILPKYRGASPIQQMILNDEKQYGVSIMRMEEGLDNGGILAIKTIPRNQQDYPALSQTLAHLGAQGLCEVLQNLSAITPILQDESKASYCAKIQKSNGLIDFANAKDIYLKSLAFNPWPGIFLPNGIKIFGVKVVENTKDFALDGVDFNNKHKDNVVYKAGEILSLYPVIVACKNGAIQIEQMQAPSKNKIDASIFLKSRAIKTGDNLLELPLV